VFSTHLSPELKLKLSDNHLELFVREIKKSDNMKHHSKQFTRLVKKLKEKHKFYRTYFLLAEMN